MTARDFCIWLEGYMTVAKVAKFEYTSDLISIIEEKLNNVDLSRMDIPPPITYPPGTRPWGPPWSPTVHHWPKTYPDITCGNKSNVDINNQS